MKTFQEFRNTEEKLFNGSLNELKDDFAMFEVDDRLILVPWALREYLDQIRVLIRRQMKKAYTKTNKKFPPTKPYIFNPNTREIEPYPYELDIHNSELSRVMNTDKSSDDRNILNKYKSLKAN